MWWLLCKDSVPLLIWSVRLLKRLLDMDARDNYYSLMLTIRERFDIQSLHSASFSQAEAAAFHGRKIVEAIAF